MAWIGDRSLVVQKLNSSMSSWYSGQVPDSLEFQAFFCILISRNLVIYQFTPLRRQTIHQYSFASS
jgi:hypothetical protein